MSLTAQRKPALAAAAFFVALAILIARFAVAPLGAADLLGIAACAAAAGAFATLAFALRAPSPGNTESRLGPADLEAFGTRMEARLAATVSAAISAAEETRRAEQQAVIAATTPPRIHDTDTVASSPSGSASTAKPRLGRGLLGLMHAPSALSAAAKPTVSAPAPGTTDEDRAAA